MGIEPEKGNDPVFEDSDEIRVHVLILIWNVQDHDFLVFQKRAELTLQASPMPALHRENDVGPFDQVGRDLYFGVWIGSS